MSNQKSKRLPKEPTQANVTALSHEGRGIAHIEGKAVFIRNALPNESVMFTTLKKHRQYDEGIMTEVLTPSKNRVTPECPHFGVCGGCSLQHLTHDAQIAHKQNVLLEQLKHIGKVVPKQILPPLVGNLWGYRHKARLGTKYVQVKEKMLVGFREIDGRFLAEMDRCLVLHPAVGEKISLLKTLIRRLSIYQQIPQIEVAVGEQVPNTNDPHVAMNFRHLAPFTPEDITLLREFAQDEHIKLYLQPGNADTIHRIWPQEGDDFLHYYLPDQISPAPSKPIEGDPSYLKELDRHRFHETPQHSQSYVRMANGSENTPETAKPIEGDPSYLKELGRRRFHETPQHSQSYVRMANGSENTPRTSKTMGLIDMRFEASDFTQVNPSINRQMINRTLDLLALESSDRVLDLFCGLGNFTLPIARKCKEVIGIEGAPSLVKRAQANAAYNHIDNATFHAADLTQDLREHTWTRGNFDKILLDPPRTGALEMIELLPALKAKRIVYVSCNPATLARDAGALCEKGYTLTSAGIMDMFPHTGHVESIGVFEKG